MNDGSQTRAMESKADSGGAKREDGRMPSLRDGGPLPRPLFCSFLATAVDPSPNFGGGVGVAARSSRSERCRSTIEFSPSPAGVGGGGGGGGGPRRLVGTCATLLTLLTVTCASHRKPYEMP
jgi:hypothetical protein